MCCRHAATGSGSSSRTVVPTASHSWSTSGSPKTASRPALVRASDDRPGDAAVASSSSWRVRRATIRALPTRRWSRSDEEIGLRVADEEQDAPLRSARSSSRESEPGRRPLELVLGPVLDLRALDALVADVNVDPAGADAVGGLGRGACEVEVLGPAVDVQVLAGLQVDTDLDREAGVRVDALLLGRHHSRNHSRAPDRTPCGASRGAARARRDEHPRDRRLRRRRDARARSRCGRSRVRGAQPVAASRHARRQRLHAWALVRVVLGRELRLARSG